MLNRPIFSCLVKGHSVDVLQIYVQTQTETPNHMLSSPSSQLRTCIYSYNMVEPTPSVTHAKKAHTHLLHIYSQ